MVHNRGLLRFIWKNKPFFSNRIKEKKIIKESVKQILFKIKPRPRNQERTQYTKNPISPINFNLEYAKQYTSTECNTGYV